MSKDTVTEKLYTLSTGDEVYRYEKSIVICPCRLFSFQLREGRERGDGPLLEHPEWDVAR